MGCIVDARSESVECGPSGACGKTAVAIGLSTFGMNTVGHEQIGWILGYESDSSDEVATPQTCRCGIADYCGAAIKSVQTNQGSKERRLTRPVSSHHGNDFTGMCGDGNSAQCNGMAMTDDGIGHRESLVAKCDGGDWQAADEWLESFAQWLGAATGISYRQG